MTVTSPAVASHLPFDILHAPPASSQSSFSGRASSPSAKTCFQTRLRAKPWARPYRRLRESRPREALPWKNLPQSRALDMAGPVSSYPSLAPIRQRLRGSTWPPGDAASDQAGRAPLRPQADPLDGACAYAARYRVLPSPFPSPHADIRSAVQTGCPWRRVYTPHRHTGQRHRTPAQGRPADRPPPPYRTISSSSSGSSIRQAAPAAISSARGLRPHVTDTHGRPVFLAKSMSTSESPT